jgi:PRTRC genetic system protein E
MFLELMPLLRERTLLITVSRLGEQLKVNVIPTKVKEGENEALTVPLSYTATPGELDSELGKHLASYVDAHLALGSTLSEAKAEMESAAKAARQKAKTTHSSVKPVPVVPEKDEPALAASITPETTPSLFAPQLETLGAEQTPSEKKEM